MSNHLPSKLRRHPFILGTLLLTGTGLISRIIGFFYRIYLARVFGEEGMGIYQLITPVLALTFSLCIGSYQTAISKYVAKESSQSNGRSYLPLFCGLKISLTLSMICSLLLTCFAPFIGTILLSEPRTVPMLRLLSWSLPFSSFHSCINGYFFGLQKTAVPALSQILEQCARVGCVFITSAILLENGRIPSIAVAILGLTFGEIVAMTYSVILFFQTLKPYKPLPALPNPYFHPVLKMAIPMTANQITLSLMQSLEAASIPSRLRLYGMSSKEALSTYGVLTGMAMPFIFFPNALTGAVALLLLPRISKDQAMGKDHEMKETIRRTITACLLLGFGAMIFFALFGRAAGTILFHSALAGQYITTLAFICPFLYLNMTLGSILNSLGLVGRMFLYHLISLSLRLGFVFFGIPWLGIPGFFYGFLTGQVILCALCVNSLWYYFKARNSLKKEKEY